jgi:RNA polymerase sigma-70 factor (ECF subfamily)
MQRDTETLLSQAAAGDSVACETLFAKHRDRLRQMVALRMDGRLSARVDPSDVVQDAFAEATRQLADYLRRRPLPFYPWLRNLAWQRLVQLHRLHVKSQKRSVEREQPWAAGKLRGDSMCRLAERLVAEDTSPSQRIIRDELLQRVQDAMSRLRPDDREILVLRHLEQLSVEETAAVLSINVGAAKARHFRAIQRLHSYLSER